MEETIEKPTAMQAYETLYRLVDEKIQFTGPAGRERDLLDAIVRDALMRLDDIENGARGDGE